MVLVVVDQFPITANMIPTKKNDSLTVAGAYRENVWKYHRFPEDVFSDRDAAFTRHSFTDLYNYLGIKHSMSPAFHSETDCEMERIGQVIESYLQADFDYAQNDSASMLAMAKYNYDNSKHSATKISPFYENYGCVPRTSRPRECQFRNPASELYRYFMNNAQGKLKLKLGESVEAMRKHYDQKQKHIEPLKAREMVMLNGRNIWAKHWCKKLEDKMLWQFQILSIGSNVGYCKLKLPELWKNRPVSNLDLLEHDQGTYQEEHVIDIEANRVEWAMESIVASGSSDENAKQHVYLAKWKDIFQEENSWKTYKNVVDSDPMLLEGYHEWNPSVEKDGRFEAKRRKKLGRKQNWCLVFHFPECLIILHFGSWVVCFVYFTRYDGAALRSPVLVKRVMLGVVP